MKEGSDTIARYRLERAFETLEEGKLLFDGKKYVGAINRIYYAMFYAINALLILEGYSSSKHSGVMSLFNKHFVRTGIVSKGAGRSFRKCLFLAQREITGTLKHSQKRKRRAL